MKFVKIIAILLLSIVGLAGIIGIFLPNHAKVERSIYIKSRATIVYELINNLNQWPSWSPWHQIDPNAIWNYSEPAFGKGAWYSWNSENHNLGSGKMSIDATVIDERVDLTLSMNGMGAAQIQFIIEGKGAQTKLSWILSKELGTNPYARYWGLLLDKMMGPDFEKGLETMKIIAEKRGAKPMILGHETDIVSMDKFQYIGIRKQVKKEALNQFLGTGFSLLIDAIKKQEVPFKGSPFTINYSVSEGKFDIEAGIRIERPMTASEDLKLGSIDSCRAFVVHYIGPYQEIGNIYQATFNYFKEQSIQAIAAPMEFYVSDPSMVKDSTQFKTDIYFRIQ